MVNYSVFIILVKNSTITHLDSKFDNIITHLDSKMKQKKYVLYKQINGFNDMFCQLVKCYTYCKKNNRLLLIDNGNHPQSMNLDFNKYFHFNTDIIITDKDKINSILKHNKLTILNNFQEYLTNNYSTYWNGMDQYGKILCDSKTGLELRFDFNKIYDEDILLYFQGGSDYNGGLLFTILRLKNDIIDLIRTKYLSIKKPYISIYVRNTDLQTDYKELYNKNKQFAR